MGRLIDADLLYKAMQDAEELARRRVRDTESTLPYPTNLNPAYTRYLAQMDERTKAKEMVANATTVDAVEVVRCKDCLHNRACEIQYHAQAGDLFFCGAAERKDGEQA